MKILKILDFILLLTFIILSFLGSHKILLFFLLFNYVYLTVTFNLYYKESKPFLVFRSLCWLYAGASFMNAVDFLANGNVYKFSIGISLLILPILCFVFKKNLKSAIALLLLAAATNTIYLSTVMVTASKAFLYTPAASGVGEVSDLGVARYYFLNISDSFTVEINLDDENSKQMKITESKVSVSEEYYYNCNIGDDINYTVYDGL